jgi:hypothetical protein
MFAYNPTVNDTSGQIQAEYNYKGASAIANGIGNFGAAVGGGLAGGMTDKANKGQMTREELDMMNGGMEFLSQQGGVDAGMLDKFHSGSIGAKRGIFNMAQLQYANNLKQQNIQMSQQGRAAGASSIDYGAPLDIQ